MDDAPDDLEPATPAQARQFARPTNAFGLRLWSALDRSANSVISPASIAVALDMASEGARGDTASEMAKVLELPKDTASFHEADGRTIAGLVATQQAGARLRFVHRLFVNRSAPLLAGYVAFTRDRFGAPTEALDFGATDAATASINGWAADATEGRIRDLLPGGAIDANTRLVLTSAVHFLGRWASAFPSKETRPASFHAGGNRQLEVPTMSGVMDLAYHSDANVELIELPYEGGDLAMLVVLPRERSGLAAVETALAGRQLEQWTARLAERRRAVHVFLPKFRIESQESTRLGATLVALGMKLAFDPNRADFGNMVSSVVPPLYIKDVFHRAFVTVDESGTEAASAAAVVMQQPSASASHERPLEFRADHPFLFLIRDRKSGLVLFIGRVVDPSSGR